MRIQIVFLVLLAVFTFGGVQKADAVADTSAVVSRMDVIIKQMEALKAEFAALVASTGTPTVPTGAVLGAQSKSIFTQSLAVGATNSDIEKIQDLLATDKEIYPYGVSSGFYGPKTEEAIKNLQTRFNLDPVGVVGPATKALLELFMAAYPDGKYPADVLKKKPAVLGASTSVPTPPVTTTPTVVLPSSGNIDDIIAKYDGKEAKVTVNYSNNTGSSFVVAGDSKIKVVDAVAAKIGKTRAAVLGWIEFTNASSKKSNSKNDEFEIDIKISKGKVTLTFEYDGDEYTVKSKTTDEDDLLEEVADELDEDVDDLDEDLVDAIEEALEDALDEGSDEIESITAYIADGEAEIEVEYGNGKEDSFTVKEDKESSIIEEVADELDIDEDEVEDLIKFKYEDIDEINVQIRPGKTAVAYVIFEDGTKKRIIIDSEDEDDIIEELADILDEDEDDIEDWVSFD